LDSDLLAARVVFENEVWSFDEFSRLSAGIVPVVRESDEVFLLLLTKMRNVDNVNEVSHHLKRTASEGLGIPLRVRARFL
jgi:hypothetical protein